jgi:hypothetical protein
VAREEILVEVDRFRHLLGTFWEPIRIVRAGGPTPTE